MPAPLKISVKRSCSLRWHYPDQVPSVGGDVWPPSQPGFPELPLQLDLSWRLQA